MKKWIILALEATILLSGCDKDSDKTDQDSTPGYAIGDYYPDAKNPATAVGVVYWLDDAANGYKPAKDGIPAKSSAGLIVDLHESSELGWSTEEITTDATDLEFGLNNMQTITRRSDWKNEYPAFVYADGLNPGGTTYAAGAKGVWFIPSNYQLRRLFAEYNQTGMWEVSPPTNQAARDAFNLKLTVAGGTPLGSYFYHTSTEDGNMTIWSLNFETGETYRRNKNNTNTIVRAVSAF